MRPYNGEALVHVQQHGEHASSGENSFGFVAFHKPTKLNSGYHPEREVAIRSLIVTVHKKRNEGVGLGDLVKKGFQKLGVDRDCTKCEKRRQLLNKIRF